MPETVITTLSKGPLKVTGEFEILNAEGAPVATEKKTVFLCRCGASKNKPFCDGAHHGIGFDDKCDTEE